MDNGFLLFIEDGHLLFCASDHATFSLILEHNTVALCSIHSVIHGSVSKGGGLDVMNLVTIWSQALFCSASTQWRASDKKFLIIVLSIIAQAVAMC